MKCFFCDRNFPTYAKLAKHLLAMHQGQEVEGARFALITSGNVPNKCLCWCGQTTLILGPGLYETLARHLKNKGGLEAHLLEIALGNQ